MNDHKKTDIGAAIDRPGLEMAAIGLESEFSLYLDDAAVRPEDVFSDPRDFLDDDSMHRMGSSYHIPTGGAVYFDSGVIEVATPVIEIENGCAARAGRSLWEAIQYLREQLDRWEQQNGKRLRLEGFSSHFNVSFDLPEAQRNEHRNEKKLALLLSYILPVPLMLLISNRKSTGIGVRPRGDRIEITADFVPNPTLMIPGATLITGVVREVMTWPSYELDMLEKMNIPVIEGFKPAKHRSRKGWLAKDDSFGINPFTCDIDEPTWTVSTSSRKQSLRQVALSIYGQFEAGIQQISGPFTCRMIPSIYSGKATSLLDLDDRPKAYEDVGRLCSWNNLISVKNLNRSRYERVLINSILRRPIALEGSIYKPVGMDGWDKVVFEQKPGGGRRSFHIDELKRHLREWERPA